MSGSGNGAWDKCPAGELERLAGRLRGRRRQRLAVQAGAVTAVSLALVAAALWTVQAARQHRMPGDISCDRVQALAEAYRKGQLSQRVREQIRQHLSECPDCAERYKALGIISAMRPAARPATPVVAALVPPCAGP